MKNQKTFFVPKGVSMKGEQKKKQDAATMTKAQLAAALEKAVRYPHKHFHKGRLMVSPRAYETPGLETNLAISPFSILDCTGSIRIGPWCNIGPRVRVYTHDTIHLGTQPLAQLENELGVLWQDKEIGTDVWIHDGSIILYQATHLPDGFVLGAGSVLTKNPGPFEIWAGNPARKVGERRDMEREAIETVLHGSRFRLTDDTGESI
jgi:carbonic anhydrase/acetyltransferase-like protein (isoleucine patch superfamily)